MTDYEFAHISDQDVEQYCRETLNGEELDKVEEHLLLCEFCCDRVSEEDDLQRGIREMLNESNTPRPWIRNRSALIWPVAVLAAAGAAVAFMGNKTPISATAAASPIALVALRSTPEPAVAPVNTVLPLTLDLRGVARASAYRVEVAASSGKKLWEEVAKASDQDEKLSVTLTAGLAAGRYWVRLLSASDQRPLREYQLEVR